MKLCRIYIGLALLLLASSCGLLQRTPTVPDDIQDIRQIPVDSAAILRMQEKAQAVLDSAARVQERRSTQPSDTTKQAVLEKGLADQVLEYAHTFLGVPYRLGASGPSQFDCSGFTRYVFQEFGYDLAHSSATQYKEARKVESFSDLRKGDLVFFGARNSIRRIGHVGIVVEVDEPRGMFRFIHASTSHGVEVQQSTHPYFMMRYIGAGRVLPDSVE